MTTLRVRGPGLALGIALSTLASPGSVYAGQDALSGTLASEVGDDRTMRETRHDVTLRFERGYARLEVERRFRNHHDEPDEAIYDLVLPARAVATGLRLWGRDASGRTVWLHGELEPADEARARYEALTNMDASRRGPRRDPALLSWSFQGGLALRVYPVPAGGQRRVAYDLDMPATWYEGAWHVDLPDLGLDGQPARLCARATNAKDGLSLDGVTIADGACLDLDASHDLSLAPADANQLRLEVASHEIDPDTHLGLWRLSMPAEIESIPEHARLVFALDQSRSLTEADARAQRQAAIAYLEHFRPKALGASVTLIGFDHEAHTLGAPWQSAAEAIEVLASEPLRAGNGSDVGAALAEAADRLRSTPEDAPRRVLVLTDFLTASSVVPEDHVTTVEGMDAVVHMATVRAGHPHAVRDDSHAWSGVAARSGGVTWRAGISPEGSELGSATFEVWARPLYYDDLRITVHTSDGDTVWNEPEFSAGDGIESLTFDRRPLESVSVHAWAWNREIVLRRPADAALGRRWAGLSIGEWAATDLGPDQLQRLAMAGGVVSPQTSFLAEEPDAEPSNRGIVRPRSLIGVSNTGLIGKGGCGGTGSGYTRGAGVAFSGRLDRGAWLTRQAAAAADSCNVGEKLRVRIESTYDELVSFEFHRSDGRALPGDQTVCVEAGLWAIQLPDTDFHDERGAWTVETPGH